jgi:Zn finger protein HypA/HybF involved in hydrogenase expression
LKKPFFIFVGGYGVLMFEFFLKPSCQHERILPNIQGGYCPDCGEYVINEWFITRCSCCGTKQVSIIKRGRVLAAQAFCKNCGGTSFHVEKLDGIDIVNVNYAVLIKKTLPSEKRSFIQTWMDETSFTPVKLLPGY